LAELRRADPNYSLFGAKYHRYQLNPPLTEPQLARFEQQHQIVLPADYRQFLRDVGNGGAGPYYGLFALEQYSELLDDLLPDFLARSFPHTAAWNADEAELDACAPSSEYEYFGNAWVQGALRICHFGCGVFLLLVVTGEARGSIWGDDRGSDQGIYPWGNFTTFTAWYEDWLDRSLEQIAKR
jgi:hypothetical protein